jgi:hypothetical protein
VGMLPLAPLSWEIRCQFIILARKDEPTPDYARVVTSQLKPTNYSLVTGSLEEWCPRALLPTSRSSTMR